MGKGNIEMFLFDSLDEVDFMVNLRVGLTTMCAFSYSSSGNSFHYYTTVTWNCNILRTV